MPIDIRTSSDRVLVGARVRPGSRPRLQETDGGLVISVAAPPEKGKANEEARRLLADALSVSASAISLRSGGTARRKVFEVETLDATTARTRLLAACGDRSAQDPS